MLSIQHSSIRDYQNNLQKYLLPLIIPLNGTDHMPLEQILRIQAISFVELEFYWFCRFGI